MKGYLIKVTDLDGRFKGESWLMRKGGYVHPDFLEDTEWAEDCYKTLGVAKRECKRLAKQNVIDLKYQECENVFNAKHGRRMMDLYVPESYEPYEVEMMGSGE